jgi:hypothetical protein
MGTRHARGVTGATRGTEHLPCQERVRVVVRQAHQDQALRVVLPALTFPAPRPIPEGRPRRAGDAGKGAVRVATGGRSCSGPEGAFARGL